MVTGGTGELGTKIGPAALVSDHHVAVIGRDVDGVARPHKADADRILALQINVTGRDSILEAFQSACAKCGTFDDLREELDT